MAGGSTKFGMFGGVFTPSILTILGVIMYLRLPWLVGSAGLTMALVVILSAHLISVTTGLSISSIATDKKVGAGGPYYIVSRSLGLPIGGTLGLALFVGLSFSISLYVIGFVESALPWFAQLDVIASRWTIPIDTPEDLKRSTVWAGTGVLVVLATITLISTSLTIKTQYFILLAIVGSVVSIFAGTSAPPPELNFGSPEGAPGFAVFFGIFFPAVTGFTAGVNMSGDLKDPKRALPRGTMLAIGAGLVVYVGLAVFLAFNVDPAILRGDSNALVTISYVGWAVFAGIWGATISSALGSLLGAPRILQALANDGVVPRFLGKGGGPSAEPRRALIVAILIAWSGILIGELDAIAGIVSIFFIATYGFLNLAAAIESWASSDFHPDFKIPKTVSVIGGIACFVVMVLLDIASTLGAALLFAAVFTVLKRRELTLESGDTWEGVWSSLVRAGVERLQHVPRLERNWRPNVLAIPRGDVDAGPLLEFGQTLIHNRGVCTALDFTKSEDGLDDQAVGVFRKRVLGDDHAQAALGAIRYHGFAGIEPNALLLDWRHRDGDADTLRTLVGEGKRQDYNLMVLAPHAERGFGKGKRIDVWWQQGRGAISLSLSLIRFLRSADHWRQASLRILFVTDEHTPADTLLKSTNRLLDRARIQAEVKIIDNGMSGRPFERWVEKESAAADLVILGLPAKLDEAFFMGADEMLGRIGTTLFVRAASSFRDQFSAERRSRAAAVRADEAELPEVVLPAQEDLAQASNALLRPLEESARRFVEDCVQTVVLQTGGLIEAVSANVMKELSNLEKEVDRTDAPRHAKALAKARSAVLFQAQRLLDDYEKETESRGDVLERQLELLDERLGEMLSEAPSKIYVVRTQEELKPAPGDSRRVIVAKRGLKSVFRKGARYTISAQPLYRFVLDEGMPALARDVLHDAASRSFQTVLDLGRELEDLRRRMAELAASEGVGLELAVLQGEKDRALEALSALADRNYQVLARARAQTVGGARDLARAFIEDIDAFDFKRRLRARKKAGKEAESVKAGLREVPSMWAHNEELLLGRVSLTLQSASLSLRLTSIVRKVRDALDRQLSERALGRLKTMRAALEGFLEADEPNRESLRMVVEVLPELDDKTIVEELVAEMQSAVGHLPESFDTLSDESILTLREAPFASVDALRVSLRRLAESLVLGEFSEALGREIAEVPAREHRASEVARDVARLVSLHVYDDDASLEGQPVVEEEDEPEGIEEVVKGALARVEAELEQLEDLRRRTLENFDQHLSKVLDRTDAYAISGTEEDVMPYIRRERSSQKALSRVSQRLARGRAFFRDKGVALLYRRSRGQLRLRSLGSEDRPEKVVERSLRLVDQLTPTPSVMSALPFHYRQLFIGHTRISSEFWVGRSEELAEAARAVALFKRGARGAIFVTGERGSGKSALCRELLARNFRGEQVHHVFPPVEGSVDVGRFNARVAGELGGRGNLVNAIAALEGNAAICLHDLELWWRRTGDGLAILKLVSDLIERYGDRCFFVINMGEHAFRFVSRLTPIAEHALAVLRCGPVDAEALKEIVLRRHRSTGIAFNLEGTDESSLAPWEEAQLFSRIFDHTKGSVGTTLQAWLAQIERLDGKTLRIKRPPPLDTEVLSHLRVEWIAILVQLLLHRRASLARLQAITGLPLSELERDLATLVRMGLLTELKAHVFEVNRYVSALLTDHLDSRGVLG